MGSEDATEAGRASVTFLGRLGVGSLGKVMDKRSPERVAGISQVKVLKVCVYGGRGG